MPRNKALSDLLDELNDEPRPRHVNWCVVCGNPIKSVNGVALCGVPVHPTYCMAEHVATCHTQSKPTASKFDESTATGKYAPRCAYPPTPNRAFSAGRMHLAISDRSASP